MQTHLQSDIQAGVPIPKLLDNRANFLSVENKLSGPDRAEPIKRISKSSFSRRGCINVDGRKPVENGSNDVRRGEAESKGVPYALAAQTGQRKEDRRYRGY
jgi:hypothetical protein